MESAIQMHGNERLRRVLRLRDILLVALMPFVFNGLCAQQSAIPPEVISIDAIRLIEVDMPVLYFRDSEGEYQVFEVSFRSRGARNKLPKGAFTLYKEGLDEDNQKVMLPSFEIPMRAINDGAILFFFSTKEGKVQYRLIDDSLDHKHAALSARLVNLTDSVVACQVGNDVVRLNAGEDKHSEVQTAKGKRFAFGFAMQEVDGFKKYSPVKSLRFPTENTRFLGAITYVAQYKTIGDGTIVRELAPTCVRLYDQEATVW